MLLGMADCNVMIGTTSKGTKRQYILQALLPPFTTAGAGIQLDQNKAIRAGVLFYAN